MLLLFIISINIVGAKKGLDIFSGKVLFWDNFVELPIILIVFSIFNITLYSKDFECKFINIISSTTLCVYLITENYMLRTYYTPRIFSYIYLEYGYNFIVAWCFALSILYFIAGVVISLMLNKTIFKLFNFISLKVANVLELEYSRIAERIEKKIEYQSDDQNSDH